MQTTNFTSPPPREPPLQGSPFSFTRTWWRFFNGLQTAGQSVKIGGYTLEVAANGNLVVIRPSGGSVTIATP